MKSFLFLSDKYLTFLKCYCLFIRSYVFIVYYESKPSGYTVDNKPSGCSYDALACIRQSIHIKPVARNFYWGVFLDKMWQNSGAFLQNCGPFK